MAQPLQPLQNVGGGPGVGQAQGAIAAPGIEIEARRHGNARPIKDLAANPALSEVSSETSA